MVGRAYQTGNIDPSAFGGPTTAVAQGSLVDSVALAVKGTPLAPLLERAYIPQLRNAVGHNSYEIVFGDGPTESLTAIRDTLSDAEWPAEAVWGARSRRRPT